MLRKVGLLLLALAAVAGTCAAANLTADDPAGDVDYFVANEHEVGATGWDSMDMLELSITELHSELIFTVTAAELVDTTRQDQGNYFVNLHRGDLRYMVRLMQDENGAPFAELWTVDMQTGIERPQRQLTGNIDFAAGKIWTSVEKTELLDEQGAPAMRGATLANITVESAAHSTGVGFYLNGEIFWPLRIADELPDEGTLSVTMDLGGVIASGDVDMEVARPFRASNGEATSYLYNIRLQNLANQKTTFELTTSNLPSGWNITLPGDGVVVGAATTVDIPTILQVPFAHQHGTSQSFILHAQSTADKDSKASAEIGVHYLEIAQPAGHHDTLYIHSRPGNIVDQSYGKTFGGSDGILTANTLSSDESDQGVPVSARQGNFGTGNTNLWLVCLEPSLRMGLQFDMTRETEAVLEVRSEAGATGATLSGNVWLYDTQSDADPCATDSQSTGDGWVQVAEIIGQDGVDIGPQSQAKLTGTVIATGNAGTYHFADSQNLVIELRVEDDGVAIGGSTTMQAMPGGSVRLPLLEYHEPVPALPSPEAEPEGPFIVLDEGPVEEDTPMPAWILLVALALPLARRRSL